MLLSEKSIDVVELSHRGKVRCISEFPLEQRNWLEKDDEINNVFVDKNGQVFLFSHTMALGDHQDKNDLYSF